MPEHIGRPDYDAIRASLYYASIHLKLAFGLQASQPTVSYLDAFSWGHHVAEHDELALTREQEDQAFAALVHWARSISAGQVHTGLERVHDDPSQKRKSESAS